MYKQVHFISLNIQFIHLIEHPCVVNYLAFLRRLIKTRLSTTHKTVLTTSINIRPIENRAYGPSLSCHEAS